MTTTTITIQQAAKQHWSPNARLLRHWAKHVLAERTAQTEVTLRLVTAEEMRILNETYRKKLGPTNVLAFPYEYPDTPQKPILGDIVICSEIVNQEALAEGKTQEAHWAHIVVHGLLHLLGYDHENEPDARVMQTLEKDILKSLQFPDPYQL